MSLLTFYATLAKTNCLTRSRARIVRTTAPKRHSCVFTMTPCRHWTLERVWNSSSLILLPPLTLSTTLYYWNKWNPSAFVNRRWHGQYPTCRTEHLLVRLRMPFLADNNWTMVYLMDRYLVRYCLPSTACHSLPSSPDTTWHTICIPMTLNFVLTSLETSLVKQILLLAESKNAPSIRSVGWRATNCSWMRPRPKQLFSTPVTPESHRQSTCVGVI